MFALFQCADFFDRNFLEISDILGFLDGVSDRHILPRPASLYFGCLDMVHFWVSETYSKKGN
jgi:hypothetical protein